MRPARNGKVLCVGRTYCDLLFTGVPGFPNPGEEIYSDSFAIHPGGGAYITAAYLAALGLDTALCTFLPTGPLGQEVMRHINQSPVDLSYCEFAKNGSEPQITVAISSADDRSFLTNRSGPALPASIGTALDDPALVHLHIAEIATLADNPDLAHAARSLGISVSLDCSWDAALLADGATMELLQAVDLFLPNEKEVRALLGIQNSLSDKLAEIAGLAPWVVVKQGARGATLFCEGTVMPCSAIPVDPVDSTGAGDAFNAGFITAWLGGSDSRDCLTAGNLSGGLAIQEIGGTGGTKQHRISASEKGPMGGIAHQR